MAETSGFFDSVYDEITKTYDREYTAKQFAEYFSLFIGNGVFASPVNQLKVVAGEGMTVIIKEGWAYINGCWYHNDSDLILLVPDNGTNNPRIDCVNVRFSESTRAIQSVYISGSTNVLRSDLNYDLQLAQITIPALSTSISNSNIVDKRPDEEVCGFVKGLVDVVDTKDLFEQYNSIFKEWFKDVKDQLKGDLAVKLQLEFNEINEDLQEYYKQTTDDISDYKKEIKNIADDALKKITEFIDKDYVIDEKVLTFTNKQCIIRDEKVKSNSLIDVYFTADTMVAAEDAKIYVDSGDGVIILTAEVQPESELRAMIRVRVRS